ncbi:MAG: tyrosine-type recombinase/integrase [Promethearchaeota archaeon]
MPRVDKFWDNKTQREQARYALKKEEGRCLSQLTREEKVALRERMRERESETVARHGNNTTPPVFFERDQVYLDEFLGDYAEQTRARVLRKLECFYKFISANSEYNSIMDIPARSFREFFRLVDSWDIRKTSKAKYRTALKRLVFHILYDWLGEGREIRRNYDIIFSTQNFKFKEGGTLLRGRPLSRDDVLECISYFRRTSFKYFVLISLLAYSGMRIGGLISLRVRDINLTDRSLSVREKRTTSSSGKNIYFFPRKFTITIRSYIAEKNLGRDDRICDVTDKTIRARMKRWRDDVHPHLFRDAINTRWEESGMPTPVREMLLNQRPTGTNARHYLKKYRDVGALREVYDRFFPY